DIIDRHSFLVPRGKVTLGGTWIMNEFRNLTVQSLSMNTLKDIARKEYAPVAVDKESLRKKQRESYQPISVKNVVQTRTIIPLDGKWLFKPAYEVNDQTLAVSPSKEDKNWHILTVPNFWNPNRNWLFGERYESA